MTQFHDDAMCTCGHTYAEHETRVDKSSMCLEDGCACWTFNSAGTTQESKPMDRDTQGLRRRGREQDR